MQQPPNLQQELLKLNRECRTWILELSNELAKEREQHAHCQSLLRYVLAKTKNSIGWEMWRMWAIKATGGDPS
jgi:hypothetical protein